jgi:hypothetical protein
MRKTRKRKRWPGRVARYKGAIIGDDYPLLYDDAARKILCEGPLKELQLTFKQIRVHTDAKEFDL